MTTLSVLEKARAILGPRVGLGSMLDGGVYCSLGAVASAVGHSDDEIVANDDLHFDDWKEPVMALARAIVKRNPQKVERRVLDAALVGLEQAEFLVWVFNDAYTSAVPLVFADAIEAEREAAGV